MLDEVVETIWVELCNVPDAFEQQRVPVLRCAGNKFIELAVSSQHVCVSLVRRQVDGQGDQLLADDWLWAVDDQLVN